MEVLASINRKFQSIYLIFSLGFFSLGALRWGFFCSGKAQRITHCTDQPRHNHRFSPLHTTFNVLKGGLDLVCVAAFLHMRKCIIMQCTSDV